MSENSLYDHVEQHTEIVGGALVWVFEEHCILRQQITGNIRYENDCISRRLDEEYSFFGDREELLDFADEYDCWDDKIEDMTIVNGVLIARYEDHSPTEYPEVVEYTDDPHEVYPEYGELVTSDGIRTDVCMPENSQGGA